jgi:hypothetical protein
MSSKYEKPLIIPFKSSSDETGLGLCKPGVTDTGQCRAGTTAAPGQCRDGNTASGCSNGTSP